MLHVSELGWQGCPWSEDSLSTKRLYPGHQFPAKEKKWLQRLKTSEVSMSLAVQRIQTTHLAAPMYIRKKVDQTRVDAYSERACVVVALATELLARFPLEKKQVDKEWTHAWGEGSEHIDTEVQALLLEKAGNLDLALHVPTFRRLVDDHMHKSPAPDLKITEAQTVEIEIDRFHLLQKQLAYDQQVFANWRNKCQTVFGAPLMLLRNT